MKKAIYSMFFALVFIFGALSFNNVSALSCGSDGKCPTGYSAETDSTTSACVCVNIFGGDDVAAVGENIGLKGTSMPQIVGNIVKVILGLFGIVATVIIVTGGVKWMLSQGDTQKIDSAKKIMIAGAIGMVLIVSGYAITAFLINGLMKTVGA
ncbi:MAG: pilin [Patescibacteria group bacterium]